MQKREINDTDFGRVLLKVNSRARNIILYTRADGLHITIPPGVKDDEIFRAIDRFRERLLNDKKKVEEKRINLDYQIDTEYFKFNLIEGKSDRFISRSELGRVTIICPPHADFDDDDLQDWLRKVIGEALRRNAKIMLPPRLKKLSMETGLSYEQVKINSSKGRWGSCSARKHINLSYYLILLPDHLIDYVMIHELCHTQEMNHSERFWKLVDSFTDGKALKLRNELRQYRLEFI